MKTFFSDKGLASSNIVLKEKDNLITDNQKLENVFNTCFINNTDTWKFQSLSEIISFYENHDSISKIKEINHSKEFSFKEVTSNEIKKVIKSLSRKRSAISSCIPVSILIDWMDMCVFISFHRRGFSWLKQNKCNARDQASDVVLRKSLNQLNGYLFAAFHRYYRLFFEKRHISRWASYQKWYRYSKKLIPYTKLTTDQLVYFLIFQKFLKD